MNNARRLWASYGGVLCLLAVGLAPFAARPFFFDDGSVVASAAASAKNPWRPYDFTLDLAAPREPAWPAGGRPVYTHPPLNAWLLSLPFQAAGPREIPFHLTMFLVSLASLWAARKLARRWIPSVSERAAAFLLASPVFFLTSLTLYPHLPYLALFCLAIFSLSALIDGERLAKIRFVAFGVCLAAAALTLHQWPMLIVLAILLLWRRPTSDRPIPWRGLAWSLGVFVLLYGGWCAWEAHVYGSFQLLASYFVRAGGHEGYPWRASFLPLVFFAGGCPVAGVAWIALVKESRPAALALAATGGIGFLIFHGPAGGFTAVQSAELAVFLATGLAFLGALVPFYKKGPRMDRTLALWFLLEFLFVQKFLAFPAGHHLLTLTLAGVFIAARWTERLGIRRRWVAAGWAASFVFTLALAQADYSQARVGVRAAATIPLPNPGKSFYWGNEFGGFEYYLKRAGWLPWDIRRRPEPGDCLLISRNMNASGPVAPLRAARWEKVSLSPFFQSNPLRTFSLGASAGWYSASWGALPYSFAAGPVDEFALIRCADASGN